MVKDPICGMNVGEKKSKEKGLIVRGERDIYFCSKNCMKKYLEKDKWYKSKSFGKIFPWFLGIMLVAGFVSAILYKFMSIYMGIVFIIFSLAKMPDWKGFVNAFSEYDILAKRVKFYGWVYPGMEFILGILFLTNQFILIAAWVTVFIMVVGVIGVAKNLLSKNQVKCACLGTTINVPLTRVTLLENILMFIMGIMVISRF